ncbi:MAG: beta-lactamase family protein [Cytophagales bacterium]|nr:beta-lactamase family protein [Cytophagales bacterium]
MKNSRRLFLKQAGLSSLGLAALPILSRCRANNNNNKNPFVFARATPESQGVDSQKLIDFVKAADSSGLEWHSFRILRHGNIIAEGFWEPFKSDYKHTLYSLSKSFTSTAIGFAVKEGLISVEDQVISFFPNELPEVIDYKLKSLKIKHLLTMNTGHDSGTMGLMRENEGNKTWVQSFLEQPLKHEPGTHFFYNTGATYMLGAIVHAKTSQNLEEYLKPRFFDKLEISDYDWEQSPEGLNTAGYGLRVKNEDIAKLGQFYLQNGTWGNEELLSAEWVEEASSKHTESQEGDGDWSQGYGYQFWRCKPAPGFYRGDGAYGQYCVIIPQYDMVIAVNSESFDMGKSMQIMWDHILPAIKNDPLPENRESNKILNALCSNLNIDTPKGLKSSSLAIEINSREYKIDDNSFGIESLTFDIAHDQGEMKILTEEGENILRFGMENWLTNEAFVKNDFPIENRIHVPSLIAATATWLNENTLSITRKFVEAVHSDTLICLFEGNKLKLSFNNSVAANSNTEDPRETLFGIA